MRVALFVTCLVDQVWPAAGHATVAVLRRAGCDVRFDPRQTCCGQPAHNAGYRSHAVRQARSWIRTFEASGCGRAVLPSGSCAAMVRHFPRLFAAEPEWRERAGRMAERTHELCEFLVDVLGVEDVGATHPGRATWHDACHALRDLRIRDQPRLLLRHVGGLELVEMPDSDACCGFGGTFATKHPELSVSIADRKCERIATADVDYVVSGDVSCLMQIEGRLSRIGSRVRGKHVAEVLAS